MPIVIKKRVSFEFLGDDYKDSYLVFQSIPLKDFEELVDQTKQAEGNNTKAVIFMLESLKKYFIEGKFPGIEAVTADDLDGLDPSSVVMCFSIFTGQELIKDNGSEVEQVADLKEQSKTASSTPLQPQ